MFRKRQALKILGLFRYFLGKEVCALSTVTLKRPTEGELLLERGREHQTPEPYCHTAF